MQQQDGKPQSLADDFQDANLGNLKLDRRLRLIGESLSERPDVSYPQAFVDSKNVDPFYDFLEHDWLTYADILKSHYEVTYRRAKLFDRPVVVHDTTEYGFPLYDENLRTHLSRRSKFRQGFFGHESLIATPGNPAALLGCIAFQPYVHRNELVDEGSEEFWQQLGGLMAPEQERWRRNIQDAERRLADKAPDAIHVLDAESDANDTLLCLHDAKGDFVARLSHLRRCVESDDVDIEHLSELLEAQPSIGTLGLRVSRRNPKYVRPHDLPGRKRRDSRAAMVEIRSCEVTFKISKNYRRKVPDAPKIMPMNLVELREVSAPKSCTPIRWVLATSLPVKTRDQAEFVVQTYKQRWIIEEFNKSVKTGCAYKKRQLQSAKTLLMALAITLPIAGDLLNLRYLSRMCPDAPAEGVVTDTQLDVLQAVLPDYQWSDEPTIGEVTGAIAEMGGHMKHNGPPGWQVLGRGYQDLLLHEAGWNAAMRQMQSGQRVSR